MKRACIVGANGFAGKHLMAELSTHGYEVHGLDIVSEDPRIRVVNMLDAEMADQAISQIKPDFVFNLAGQASPSASWHSIVSTLHSNIDISVHLATSIDRHCPDARLLLIGSANQYDVASVGTKSVTEDMPQRSDSPYAVSKQAQEQLLRLLAQRLGLFVVFTRTFNHIGPGQRQGFVVSDFASQIAAAERAGHGVIRVGNLESWRDFSDVRDTVRAYRLLLEKGQKNEVYNVGSGKAYQIRSILDRLLSFSKIDIPVETSITGMLPKKEAALVSDNSKILHDTGYQCSIDIETSLRDALESFREKT